jgi:hypothetical protein
VAIRWYHEKWRKLYVREEGSFAALPLFARALGGQLLKLADEQGRIRLGGRDAVSAVAFQSGADLSDRRLLRKLLPMLIHDGYLVEEPGVLRIRNFVPAQNKSRTGFDLVREGDVSETRDGREPDATETRARHEPDAKIEVLGGNPSSSSGCIDPKRNVTTPSEGEAESEADRKKHETRDLIRRIRADHVAMLDLLETEGIGNGGKSLQPTDEIDLVRLVRRLSEALDSAGVLAYCRHVLEVRASEARSFSPPSARYCGGAIWRSDNIERSAPRTVAEFKEHGHGPFPWTAAAAETADHPGAVDGWTTHSMTIDGKRYQVHRDGEYRLWPEAP